MNTGKKLILFAISFLFMLYPLGLLTSENPATKLPVSENIIHASDANQKLPAAETANQNSSSHAGSAPQNPEDPATSASTLSAVQPNTSKLSDKGVPVLMYHSISTNPSNSLCVSEKDFAAQMEWLKSQNYHTITVEQLNNALTKGTALPEKPVLITFDDGYRDNYIAAWPILKQNGLVGTFFIISNAIVPSRIDWDELKDLIKHGNSIGSHTVNHLDLRTLSESQQESELRDSKKIMEERLGIKIISFCYPAGKYNKTTLSLLKKHDYKMAFTTDSGRVHTGDDMLELSRVRISGGMSLSSFKYLLT